jgi:hypothetical protein
MTRMGIMQESAKTMRNCFRDFSPAMGLNSVICARFFPHRYGATDPGAQQDFLSEAP